MSNNDKPEPLGVQHYILAGCIVGWCAALTVLALFPDTASAIAGFLRGGSN